MTDVNVPSTAAESSVPADRTIEVILPARIDMASTLRLFCASVGVEAGFSLDEVDDLRLSASEVLTSVADLDESDRVSVTLVPGPSSVAVTMRTVSDVPIELDALASTILAAAVDDLSVEAGVVRFTKRSNEAEPSLDA